MKFVITVLFTSLTQDIEHSLKILTHSQSKGYGLMYKTIMTHPYAFLEY